MENISQSEAENHCYLYKSKSHASVLNKIMDCIECGSCQFTCPTNRPLLYYCRLGKSKVGTMIRARQAKK